jgi:hypothetical protein
MKKHLFLAIFILSANLFAQKIKYKDVFGLITANQKQEAYPYLKLLLKTDSNLANANLQVALICYEKAKSFDVLKQNAGIASFADTAILYFSKAQRTITEKEIRKNDEYYLSYKNLPKPIENRDSILKRVQNDIANKKREIADYKANTKQIFKNFNKGVEAYNIASKLFKQLNYKFISTKELCLLSDENTIKDLQKISQNFDSSVIYINTYKKLIAAFPIQGYNQNYQIQAIETYRIDGLSKTDFLSNSISLWNYSEWAKGILIQINSDIKKIREQLQTVDLKITSCIEKMQQGKLNPDSALNIKPDLKFIRLINKYDYNSLALRILDYKQCKMEYVANSLLPLGSLENTHAGNIESKAAQFSFLGQKIKSCDTLLNSIQESKPSQEIPKYATYFTKNFVDSVGFKKYASGEKDFISSGKKEQTTRFSLLIYGQKQRYNDTTIYFPYNEQQIPFFRSYELSKTVAKTISINEDKKGNIYVAGMLNNQAFICKMTPQKQVLWLKQISLKFPGSSQEFISSVEPIEEGCYLVLNAKIGTQIKNSIIKLDKSGIELSSKIISSGGVVRSIVYDELNDQFVLASKGNTLQDYSPLEEAVTLSCYDGQGVLKWNQNFSLLGSVVEVSKITEGFLLVCNYTIFNTGATKIESRAGNTLTTPNVLLLKFSPSGDIKANETITSANPIYSLGTVKITNSKIFVLSIEDNFLQGNVYIRPEARNSKLYKMINSDLQFVY